VLSVALREVVDVGADGRHGPQDAPHRSYGDRAAMAEAAASSALLELTLVGTALAQKRTSRILEILRADKGKQVADDVSAVVATVSAPQERRCRGEEESVDGEFDDTGMSAEKRAVRQLV